MNINLTLDRAVAQALLASTQLSLDALTQGAGCRPAGNISPGEIETLQQQVAEHGPDACAALTDALGESEDDQASVYRQAAIAEWSDDAIQIDPGASVSLSSDGAWVAAWLWVDSPDAS